MNFKLIYKALSTLKKGKKTGTLIFGIDLNNLSTSEFIY